MLAIFDRRKASGRRLLEEMAEADCSPEGVALRRQLRWERQQLRQLRSSSSLRR